MSNISARYPQAHIASPDSRHRPAQPRVATSPTHYFTLSPMSPIVPAHPHIAIPLQPGAPGVPSGNSAQYCPTSPSHPLQATGYPYVPHNATQVELEACTRRMRSVQLRRNRAAYSEPGSDTNGPSGGRPRSHSPLGADEGCMSDSSHEAHSSPGPETPNSPMFGFRYEAAKPMSASARKAPPASAPVAPHVPADDGDSEPEAPGSAVDEASNPSSDSDVEDSKYIARAIIREILYELNSSVLTFIMPGDLELSAPKNGETLPQLPYTARNKPLIHHRHDLEALLDRLDKVESHGDFEIRFMRKRAVDEVELSLKELNRMQCMAWAVQQYESKHKRT